MKVNLRLLFIPVVLSFSLIWLWPFRPLPLNGFTQEVLSFSAALIVLLSLLTRKTVLRKSFLVFLGLAFIPLLQYCFGLIPFVGNAWLVSVYLFSFALMLSAGYSLSPGRSTLRSAGTIAPIDLLAVVFVLAAALSSPCSLSPVAGAFILRSHVAMNLPCGHSLLIDSNNNEQKISRLKRLIVRKRAI